MDGRTTIHRRLLGLVAVAVLAAVPSCAGSDSGSGSPDAEVSPRPSCAEESDEVSVRELDGGLTETTIGFGEGTRGVVLSPQSDGDACEWVEFGRRLADEGYRVVTFGPWGTSFPPQVTHAAENLREAGATSVVLMGSSQGATTSLAIAADLKPPPAGVVAISGQTKAQDGSDALGGIARFAGPLLMIGSEDDAYVVGDATRQMAQAHPGAETVVIFPGYLHGLDLLEDDEGVRSTAEIDAFLTKALPER